MSRHVLSLVALVAFAVGCNNNKNAMDSIPDKPTLRMTPSTPLTMDEYNQFKVFVAAENGLPMFLPQSYLFATTDESHLTPDQQNALLKIRGACLHTDTPDQQSGTDSSGTHRVVYITDARDVSGTGCPMSYSLNSQIAMVAADGSTQDNLSATGPATVKEALFTSDMQLSTAFGQTHSSMDSSGTFTIAKSGDTAKVRSQMTSSNVWNSTATQYSYTGSTNSDFIIVINNATQTGSVGMAVNISITVPHMTKDVVISFSGTVDPGTGQTVVEQFLVNGSPVVGSDQAQFGNSAFLTSIVMRILTSSGINSMSSLANRASQSLAQ